MPALLQAITAIVAQTNTGAVLRTFVLAAVELVHADYGAFAVLDGDGAVVYLVELPSRQFGDHQFSNDVIERLGRLPERSGTLARLIGAGGPIRLDDITSHAACVDFAPRHPQMVALLGTPTQVGCRVFGVLYLTRTSDRHAFSGDEELEIRALSTQAGLAIANARAIESGRQREESLRTLGFVATGLSSGLELADVLPTVIRQARDIVDADFAAVALLSDDPNMLTVQYGDGVDAAHLIG